MPNRISFAATDTLAQPVEIEKRCYLRYALDEKSFSDSRTVYATTIYMAKNSAVQIYPSYVTNFPNPGRAVFKGHDRDALIFTMRLPVLASNQPWESRVAN